MIYGPARHRTLIGLIALATVAASLGTEVFRPAVARAADAASTALTAPTDTELQQAAATELPAPPVATTADLDLATLAEKAFAVADKLPAQDWELQALADALEYDPARAFAFVRDSIRFEAYAGVLRGAFGTLAARAGNSEDRALLLGALLDAMAIPYRFAIGDLDDATAQRVAARTFDAPTTPLDASDGSRTIHFDTEAIAVRARRDDALLRLALGDRLSTADGRDASDPVAEVRRHVWVQVASGPEWIDDDPTLLDAQPGQMLTTATSTAATLPAADDQTMTVDVVDHTLQGGQLVESTVLEHTFDAASASPSEIFLYFQPEISGLGGSIDQVLGAATSYYPVLLINGTTEQGTTFPVKQGMDIFTGDVSTTDPVVAGLELKITVAGPGMPARTATRTLLDRVPPDLAPGATITPEQLAPLVGGEVAPTVLGMVHHIAVSTGSTSLRAYASQQGAVLDFIGLEDPSAPSDYSLGSQLWPVAVGDLGLVMMSERTLVPAVADRSDIHTYIASPRVYVSSFGPDATADVIDTQMDLMLDGVRIAAPPDVPGSRLALARLWYGVLQSALETEQALRNMSGQDPGTATLTGVSLSMTEPLTIVGGDPGTAIPQGAPAALRTAAARGLIAVVPGPLDGAKVWWTIDPTTGETRSILDPGLGGMARSSSLAVARSTISDTTYGKSDGAGSKFARSAPRQGVNQNAGRGWSSTGNGYYENGEYHDLNRPAPVPARCPKGQEYTMLLGCVSVPAAWAMRFVGLVVAIGVFYVVNHAYQGWLKN